MTDIQRYHKIGLRTARNDRLVSRVRQRPLHRLDARIHHRFNGGRKRPGSTSVVQTKRVPLPAGTASAEAWWNFALPPSAA
jgi:hypothetical protein